jgi:hypothetical protein
MNDFGPETLDLRRLRRETSQTIDAQSLLV